MLHSLLWINLLLKKVCEFLGENLKRQKAIEDRERSIENNIELSKHKEEKKGRGKSIESSNAN